MITNVRPIQRLLGAKPSRAVYADPFNICPRTNAHSPDSPTWGPIGAAQPRPPHRTAPDLTRRASPTVGLATRESPLPPVSEFADRVEPDGSSSSICLMSA